MSDILPDESLPDESLPDESLPDESLPDESLPENGEDDGIENDGVEDDGSTDVEGDVDEEEPFDYMSPIKMLLGIEDEKHDVILNYYLNRIVQYILNYCNRSDLPPELNYVVCEMVVELFNNTQGSLDDNGNLKTGNVASVTEDGRTVEFSNNLTSATVLLNETLSNRKRELNKFKKVYKL
jgi:hypothetical protein